MIDETVIGTLKSTSIATYIGLTILSYLSTIQFCFSSRKIPKQDLWRRNTTCELNPEAQRFEK